MPSIERLVAEMRRSPQGVRFSDLERVCRHYFGEPRQRGSSHQVFRTPWQGDPRVNIQDDHGSAKPYQVRQVLAAIEKVEQEER
ncbi:toxin HicA [Cellulomonas xiejunii]|uniref:Toxin HicA n=1 Tax=Cellulomonas xiejunii TaxID=2968083 RepID=A0ABY5KKE5_9CELL|nr:toxin HicA [Cellulomonas xiejunii]MCC2319894.1 toxin HicA [Cellulomonas xiejunii]UUI70218.1 toxin HicA [Cellulomonas xiejunii]